MGLFTKISPKGIDIRIQKLQTYLFTELCSTWNLDADDWNAYGRAYRNQSTDGYIPEGFTGKSNSKGVDYDELYFNDGVSVNSFFSVGDIVKRKLNAATAQVGIIFMVDLVKLKPGIAHRADEEVRLDVEKLLSTSIYGFEMTGYVTGIDQVFKEFAGIRKKDGIKFRDQHPTHCFRLDTEILYNVFDCP